jgi:hypothetical protein
MLSDSHRSLRSSISRYNSSVRIAVSAAIGLSVAAIGIVIEFLATGEPILSIDSLDNIITGILTSVIVFAYEQKRYSQAIEKLKIVSQMNHHVRNALQVIISSGIYSEHDKQMKAIAEAAHRIERALCEVLPGRSA